MKDSEIYLRAAEVCTEPERDGARRWFPSCQWGLEDWHADVRLLREFEEYFPHDNEPDYTSDFGSCLDSCGAHNSHYRVIALCFMAAIAKSEGR